MIKNIFLYKPFIRSRSFRAEFRQMLRQSSLRMFDQVQSKDFYLKNKSIASLQIYYDVCLRGAFSAYYVNLAILRLHYPAIFFLLSFFLLPVIYPRFTGNRRFFELSAVYEKISFIRICFVFFARNTKYIIFAIYALFSERKGALQRNFAVNTCVHSLQNDIACAGFFDDLPREHVAYFPYSNTDSLRLCANNMYFIDRLKAVLIIVYYYVTSIVFLLVGKWNRLLLFRDISMSILFRKASLFSSATVHFFLYNGSCQRPYWSYDERISKQARLIFLSMGNDVILDNNFAEFNEYSYMHEYSLMSWDRYIVWSKSHQKIMSKSILTDSKFSYLDRRLLHKGSVSSDKKIYKSIIIFDLPPRKRSLVDSHSYGYDFNNIVSPQLTFIDDIVHIAQQLNIKAYLKTKRPESFFLRTKKSYVRLIHKYTESGQLTMLDDVDPRSLANSGNYFISYPLTSTAFLFQRCTSVYYNPTHHPIRNELERDVIYGRNSLFDAVESFFS